MWKFLAVMSIVFLFPIWAGYNGTNTAAWVVAGLILFVPVVKGVLFDD